MSASPRKAFDVTYADSAPITVTPEYPKGRRVVVIANDITFKIGSFGPLEDDYFMKATEVARKLGLPRESRQSVTPRCTLPDHNAVL